MRRAFIIVAAVLLPVATGATAPAAELTGRPQIVSGDTLVLAGQRLHLYGVDAPEPGQECRLGNGRVYDCGLVSRTALMDLTAGVPITCRTQHVGPGEGIAAACFADGYDLSHGMAHTGWALADPETGGRYLRAQENARTARRGMWRGTFVAPKDWRNGGRLPRDPRRPD